VCGQHLRPATNKSASGMIRGTSARQRQIF
jgi:hypothetical protein